MHAFLGGLNGIINTTSCLFTFDWALRRSTYLYSTLDVTINSMFFFYLFQVSNFSQRVRL